MKYSDTEHWVVWSNISTGFTLKCNIIRCVHGGHTSDTTLLNDWSWNQLQKEWFQLHRGARAESSPDLGVEINLKFWSEYLFSSRRSCSILARHLRELWVSREESSLLVTLMGNKIILINSFHFTAGKILSMKLEAF